LKLANYFFSVKSVAAKKEKNKDAKAAPKKQKKERVFKKDPKLSDVENFIASIDYENFGTVDVEYTKSAYTFQSMQVSISLSSLNPATMFKSAQSAVSSAVSKVESTVKSEVSKVSSTLKTGLSSEIKSASTELTSLTKGAKAGSGAYGLISSVSSDYETAEKDAASLEKSAASAEKDLENPLGTAESAAAGALASAEKSAQSTLSTLEKSFENMNPLKKFTTVTEQVINHLYYHCHAISDIISH